MNVCELLCSYLLKSTIQIKHIFYFRNDLVDSFWDNLQKNSTHVALMMIKYNSDYNNCHLDSLSENHYLLDSTDQICWWMTDWLLSRQILLRILPKYHLSLVPITANFFSFIRWLDTEIFLPISSNFSVGVSLYKAFPSLAGSGIKELIWFMERKDMSNVIHQCDQKYKSSCSSCFKVFLRTHLKINWPAYILKDLMQ